MGRGDTGQDACIPVIESQTLDEVQCVSLRPRADRPVATVSNIQVPERTEWRLRKDQEDQKSRYAPLPEARLLEGRKEARLLGRGSQDMKMGREHLAGASGRSGRMGRSTRSRAVQRCSSRRDRWSHSQRGGAGGCKAEQAGHVGAESPGRRG